MRPSPKPTGFWRADGVHFVAVGADIVILDVDRDQYHCLPDAAGLLSVGPDGRVGAPDPAGLTPLVEAGLIASRPPATTAAPIAPATRALALGVPVRGDLLRAGLALAAGTAAFRGSSLARLIAAPRRRPVAVLDETRLARLVSAARAARPWIPFEGECLQRAYQLRRFLAGDGLAVDWVFGVRTWPFGAHCWLQAGDLVIGDRLERVGRYTPILKV